MPQTALESGVVQPAKDGEGVLVVQQDTDPVQEDRDPEIDVTPPLENDSLPPPPQGAPSLATEDPPLQSDPAPNRPMTHAGSGGTGKWAWRLHQRRSKEQELLIKLKSRKEHVACLSDTK